MDKDPRLRIEITPQEAQALLQRGEDHCFDPRDYAIAVAIIRNYFALDHAYQEKSHAVQRLLNRFFSRTEKAKAVLKNAGPPEMPPPAPRKLRKASQPRKSPKAMAETARHRIRARAKSVSLSPTTKREIRARSVPKASSTPWRNRGWKSGS